jgi:hypothetical protein
VDEARLPRLRFSPSAPLAWLAAGAAVICAGIAAFDGDPAGRLILGIAAVLLAGLAGTDLLVVPRLAVSAEGVTVRTLSVRRRLPWAHIESIRLDERSRLGLSSRTLEIDAGELLIVLGRHSLGADPREVYPLVLALQPR